MTKRTYQLTSFLTALTFAVACILGNRWYPHPSHTTRAKTLFAIAILSIFVFSYCVIRLRKYIEGVEQFVSDRGGFYSFFIVQSILVFFALGNAAFGWRISIFEIYTLGWMAFGITQVALFWSRLR